MIGIIVEAQTNGGTLPNRIFYKFGKQTVLDRVLRTCVKCDYAHKVVLAMPSSDKPFIHGNVFQNGSVSLGTIEYLDRGVAPIFHGRAEQELDRIYYAALTANLATIVRISAENVLMPTWLINQVVAQYCSNKQEEYLVVGPPEHNEGFSMEIFPFWMLAHAHINCDDQSGLGGHLEKTFGKKMVPNDGINLIPGAAQSFRFRDKDQVEELGRLLEEIDLGADVGGLIGEQNE